MEIRCPYCLVPFDSTEEISWSDIVCPSCGKGFGAPGDESTCSYRPGVHVMGRFELLHEVGAGRFGSVWKARDTQLQRHVAVKIPRQPLLDAHETDAFLRDARAAAQLKHSRIASVHEVGREDGTVYIVSDFIDGADLGQWLTGREVSPDQAAELVIKIADALHHAHEAGVVHRDVKPSNIMLDSSGEPYVIDFGLARRETGEMTVTADGQLLGTPAYMSPEQARGESHQADRRSDIYSLGVVLFKLLTGELPFRGQARMLLLQILQEEPPHLRKLHANVPRDLETITLKCLEKEPAKRYQTARELGDDLRCYISGEPILARPVSRFERGWRWCKRHQAVAWLSGVLLLLLTTISIVAPIVAVHQIRLRRESEQRRIEVQNEIARSLFQRGGEEYSAGRRSEGIALLARAYELLGSREEAKDSDNRLRESIRRLISGWSQQSGQPLVQNKAVLAAAFSPDGKTILIGGHDPNCRARFWDAQTHLPIGAPLPHGQSVRAAAFSPNGALAITGSEDGAARFWDVRTRSPVGSPMLHWSGGQSRQVWAVAFGPDGIVATGGRDNAVRLWQAPSGSPLGEPINFKELIYSVSFDPTGKSVLTGSFDGTARRWDIQSRQPLGKTIQLSSRPVYSARFSPDGSKILTGGTEGSAQLWEAGDGKVLGDLHGHTNEVYAVAFGPDGRTVLTGSHDNTARLWDAKTREPLGEPFQHGGIVMTVAYSPDGRTVMTGSADYTVRLWNVSDSGGRVLRHDGEIRSAAFSPDGRAVLTGGDDKSARLWNARSGAPLGEPLSHDGPVTVVSFSPDGRTLFTGSKTLVHCWNAQTGKPAGEAWKCGGEVRQVGFSADGRTALVHCVNDDKKSQAIELRDFPSGRLHGKPLKFNADDLLIAWSPDVHAAVIGHIRGDHTTEAELWDISTGKSTGKSLRHEAQILTGTYTRDGRTVVSAGRDQQIRLWEAETGTAGKAFQHNGVVNVICVSRDETMILSGSDDKTARIWNIETGLALGPVLQHSAPVMKVALSADGRVAATICSDGSASLWDVFSSKRLARPLQYEGPVRDCQFNSDGSEILFRCADGTTRLYDVPRPLPSDPALIRTWARARSGFELDDKLEPRQLSQAEWLKAQERLISLEQGG